MKWSPSTSLHIHTQVCMKTPASVINQTRIILSHNEKKRECMLHTCVCDQTSGKHGVTGWVNGGEEDMAPMPLPVLYILKYTNVFNSVDPIYYESRLISLICVEKISIYKARSPVK